MGNIGGYLASGILEGLAGKRGSIGKPILETCQGEIFGKPGSGETFGEPGKGENILGTWQGGKHLGNLARGKTFG